MNTDLQQNVSTTCNVYIYHIEYLGFFQLQAFTSCLLQADAEISVLKDIVVDNVKWKLTNKYTKPKGIWKKKIAEENTA